MFSAHDYATKRYADNAGNAGHAGVPSASVVQRLQDIVAACGLIEDEAYVTELLNLLTSADHLTMGEVLAAGKWLQRAAAMRDLGTHWEQAFVEYMRNPGEADGKLTDFYQSCMGTDLLPFQPMENAPARTDPLVLLSRPVVRTEIATGKRAGFMYANLEEITIGLGLFEIIAGLRAQAGYMGSLKLGVLQFATSKRIATYEGLTVSRIFEHALDSSARPWFNGASTFVLPRQQKTAVSAADAPKWNLPTQWARKQKLLDIAIDDSFVTHVVVQTRPNVFTTHYTCEWTFTARYDAANPHAASASYAIQTQGPANGEIKLTGQELIANDFPDEVTS